MYVTRGEGVKKCEIFMDVIDGSPPTVNPIILGLRVALFRVLVASGHGFTQPFPKY